jgi:hypothetical protein
MTRHPTTLLRTVLVCSLLVVPSAWLRADGGALRVSERAGNYRIAVFTAPTPVRAGPVDVSVLVQDVTTGECLSETRVSVQLTRADSGYVLHGPATTAVATNKLFHAAVFELPEPGWWQVAVAVEGRHGPASVRFGILADEPLPRWVELWPWFGWPVLAVALFGVHRILVRKPRATSPSPVVGGPLSSAPRHSAAAQRPSAADSHRTARLDD